MMMKLFGCKLSRQPTNHINISNLLRRQVSGQLLYESKPRYKGMEMWWWGRGLLTSTAGLQFFLFSIYDQIQRGGCLSEMQNQTRGHRTSQQAILESERKSVTQTLKVDVNQVT